jgi:hypothetical protein
MLTAAKRERLRQYIDSANNKDIDDLLQYVENGLNPDVAYNKWDDAEFVAEIESRV